MKKAIPILLTLVMVLSLVACGSNTIEGTDAPPSEKTNSITEEPTTTSETVSVLSKDEMLAEAHPLTREEVEKSISNMAYAKSLIGNIYTFRGDIFSVEEEYVTVTFYIEDEQGNYATAANVMTANIYLPTDELVSLETKQSLLFVGQLDDVSTHDDDIPDWGTSKVVDMVFKNAAIAGDRFEESGKLHSKNASYGADAWNIMPPDSNYAYVVHFRDDVSAYLGKTITFSYKKTAEGNVDAYIIK